MADTPLVANQFKRWFVCGLVLPALSLSLMACDSPPEDVSTNLQPQSGQTDEVQSQDQQIPWFEGTSEQAFDQAKQSGKPVFLYWGAVWCPPCEEIKQTVFKSPEFIALSHSFIPVYLDGDTERAQTLGETYSVYGYPTMIVFNPKGEEIIRIPGGIEIDRYNRILGQSLESLTPTVTLVERGLADPSSLTAADFNQIAFYSWEQVAPEMASLLNAEAFATLALQAEVKADAISSNRIYLHSLLKRLQSEEPLSPMEQQTALTRLQAILADEQLALANLDYLVYWSEELVQLVTSPGDAQAQLIDQWVGAVRKARYLPSLSKSEQLGTWYPELLLFWLSNPKAEQIPQALQLEITAHIEDLDSSTKGSARQTVLNKAYQVYGLAKMPEQSRAILLAEIETSKEPYYFMSGMASLEEKAGNTEEAVLWLKRAYDAANGSATRFQWGVEYITGAMELTPDNVEPVGEALAGLLDNLEQPQAVFTGRNLHRLKRLQETLGQWQAGRAYVQAFNEKIDQACAATVEASLANTNCLALNSD